MNGRYVGVHRTSEIRQPDVGGSQYAEATSAIEKLS